MRRLNTPEDVRQGSSWLWLVVMSLLICVALNGVSMLTQIESDGDVASLATKPAFVLAPRPTP